MGKGSKGIANIGLSAGMFFVTGGWSAVAKGLGMMALGQLLTSNQHLQGQRLNSLAVTLDTEGSELIKGWGTWRQGLHLVASSSLVEHKKSERAGKGGPKTDSYSYSTRLVYEGGRGPITRLNQIKLNQFSEYDWNGGDEIGAELEFADGHWSGETEKGVKFRVYPGTLEQPVDTYFEEVKGVGNWTNYPNQWVLVVEIPNLEKYGNAQPQITVECYNSVTAVDDIILEIASWVNMTPEMFDLSALAGLTVAPTEGEGFLIDGRKTAAAAIVELMEQFYFSLPEIDGKLVAVLRNTPRVRVFESHQLRLHTPNEPTPNTVFTLADPKTLPQVQELIARDPDRGHSAGYSAAYRYQDDETTGTRRKDGVTLSASIIGPRLQQMAEIRLAQTWARGDTANLSFGLDNFDLTPGDVIGVMDEDGITDMLLPELTIPFFGPLSSPSVGIDLPAYGIGLGADTDGLGRSTPPQNGVPLFFIGECTAPPLGSGFFGRPGILTGYCILPGDVGTSAVINIDRELDGVWKEIAEVIVSTPVVIGELTAPYSPASPEDGFDADAQINCKVYNGGLYSTTPEDLPSGANVILFETGVFAAFETATETAVSGGIRFYDLSNIRGGLYNSDDLIDGPIPIGTRFVLVKDEAGYTSAGLKWIEIKRDFIDVTNLRLRGNAVDASTQAITEMGLFHARNVEEPSPHIVEATRSDEGALILRGTARSRYAEDVSLLSGVRASAPQFSGKFKYFLTLESGALSRTDDYTTDDDEGSFEWTVSATDLETLFGEEPGALTGTLAIYGEFGPGRKASFSTD